jgi:hypothetical protein
MDRAIKSLYEQHSSILLSSPQLTTDDHAFIQRTIKAREIEQDNLKREDLEASLKELSRLLYKHTAKPVFILIDEYDAPLNAAYKDETFLNQVTGFMANLFSAALKDNPYLKKGMMTGVLRISQNSMLSGLNNFKVYTPLQDSFFAPYFGFTEAEVIELLKNSDMLHPLEDIKYFYNGYQIHDQTLYNPWAINNYLEEHRLATYWLHSGNDQLLRDLFPTLPVTIKKQLQQLIEGAYPEVSVNLSDRVQFQYLKDDPAAFWSILLSTGYLTLADEPRWADTCYEARVRIPNQEVRSLYVGIFKNWLQQHAAEEPKTLVSDLLAHRLDEFAQKISTYLLRCTSYHDFLDESHYHTFMLGILSHLVNTHQLYSNIETGLGRADMLLIPKDPNDTSAFIMEFKHAKKRSALTKEANRALNQMDHKRYAALILQQPHIQNIMEVGMAFHGKDAFACSQVKQVAVRDW